MKRNLLILVSIFLFILVGLLYIQSSKGIKEIVDRSVYETDNYSFSVPKDYTVSSLRYIDYNNAVSFVPEGTESCAGDCDYTPEIMFVDNSEKNIEFYWNPTKYEDLKIGKYDVELWLETPEEDASYLPVCQYQFRIFDGKYVFCLNSLNESGLTEIRKRISSFTVNRE